MDPQQALTISRDGLLTLLTVCGPIVLVVLAVGLVVSIFQAATQINESTLSFVPKLIAAVAVLAVAGPWMITTLVEYLQRTLQAIPPGLPPAPELARSEATVRPPLLDAFPSAEGYTVFRTSVSGSQKYVTMNIIKQFTDTTIEGKAKGNVSKGVPRNTLGSVSAGYDKSPPMIGPTTLPIDPITPK